MNITMAIAAVISISLVGFLVWYILHTKIYRVITDYYQTVEDLIKAAQFERVDFSLSHRYANEDRYWYSEDKKTNTIKMRLFYFEDETTEREAIKYMGEYGYRPANLRELLFFKSQYPDACYSKNIIALRATFYPSWDCLESEHIVQSSHNNTLSAYLHKKKVGGRWVNEYYLAVYETRN